MMQKIKLQQQVFKLALGGLKEKKYHFIAKPCGSLEELDYWLNSFANSNYKVLEIFRSQTEFFQNYEVIACKELPSKKKRKRKKSKKRGF